MSLYSRWDLVLDFDLESDWRLDQWRPFNDQNPPETIGAPLPPRYALKLHRQIRRFAPLYEQAESARQAAVHSRNGQQRSVSPYRVRPSSSGLASRPEHVRNTSGGTSSFSARSSLGSSSSSRHGSDIAFKPIDLPQDASESLKLLAAREAIGSRNSGDNNGADAGANPDSRNPGSSPKSPPRESAIQKPSRSSKSRASVKKNAHSVLTLTVLNVIEGSDSDVDSDGENTDEDDSGDAHDHRWLVVPNTELLGSNDNTKDIEDKDNKGEESSSGSPTVDSESDASPSSADTPPLFSKGAEWQKARLYSVRKAFFAVLASLLKGYREYIKTEERLRATTDLQRSSTAGALPPGAAEGVSRPSTSSDTSADAPAHKNFLASLTESMRPGALGEAVDKPSAFEFADEYAMDEVFDAASFVAMREASGAEDWHLKHFLTIFLKQVSLRWEFLLTCLNAHAWSKWGTVRGD